MTTESKAIEICCLTDEFVKNLHAELQEKPQAGSSSKRERHGRMMPRLQIPLAVQRLRGNHDFLPHKSKRGRQGRGARNVSGKGLYGKAFADRGRIKRELFEGFFGKGVRFCSGLEADMKNRLTLVRDKIMLRKKRVIGRISGFLKNKAGLAYSRRRLYISKRQGSLACPDWREKLSRTRV